LLDSLNRFGTDGQISSPDDIIGCKNCSIAVYCNSGSRAGQAITILEQNGFTGPLYNGLGVVQWSNAGYELVSTPSFDPGCVERGTCCNLTQVTTCELVVGATEVPVPPPTMPPTMPPTIADSGSSPVSPPPTVTSAGATMTMVSVVAVMNMVIGFGVAMLLLAM
jgi:hypothetical protein